MESPVVLMNYNELNICRVAAVNAGSYWQSFVYVECTPQSPIGPHKYTRDQIDQMVRNYGYADEEIGLFKGHAITRAEFDDGAAVIDGKIVRTEGTELRVRFLSAYNFLIASQGSPINDNAFDEISEKLLNSLLQSSASFDELVTQVMALKKRKPPRYKW